MSEDLGTKVVGIGEAYKRATADMTADQRQDFTKMVVDVCHGFEWAAETVTRLFGPATPARPVNEPSRLPAPDEVIDKDRAAAVLQCDVRTVERHIDAGKLEAFKVGTLVRIKGECLLRFIRDQSTGRKGRG